MTETATATPAIDHAAVAAQYVRFWNTGAPEGIAQLTFADDVEYCTPLGRWVGPQALAEFKEQFRQHHERYEFRLRAEPEGHHNRVRLLWELTVPTAEPFAQGTDVLVVDAQSRIRTITVFLDQAPEGFDTPARH